jgi:hypothetical protein
MSYFCYVGFPKSNVSPLPDSLALKQAEADENEILSTQAKGFNFFEIRNTNLHHGSGNLLEKNRGLLQKCLQIYLSQNRKLLFAMCWGTVTQVKCFTQKVKIFIEDFVNLEKLDDNTCYLIYGIKEDVK